MHFHIYIYYVNDDVTQNTNYRRILKCSFLLCFLICLCATTVKGVILCNFCKLSWKVEQSGLFCATLYSTIIDNWVQHNIHLHHQIIIYHLSVSTITKGQMISQKIFATRKTKQIMVATCWYEVLLAFTDTLSNLSELYVWSILWMERSSTSAVTM